jgi:hypothetical protein
VGDSRDFYMNASIDILLSHIALQVKFNQRAIQSIHIHVQEETTITKTRAIE